MKDAFDASVGARIKLRRRVMGLSQQTLASQTGVTFQQIQKYERGVNRVSSSRLQMIATALQVSPSFFFEDEESEKPGENIETSLEVSRDMSELMKAYVRIVDTKKRAAILTLIEGLADDGPRDSDD